MGFKLWRADDEGLASDSTGPAAAPQAPHSHLLLAPLDSDADLALTRALEAGGFAFERSGPALLVQDAREHLAALNTLLTGRIPPALQSQVKAVLVDGSDDPTSVALSYLRAEALPVFFEQTDLDWARQALREDWLFSVFQPVMTAATGTIHAYEALVRARNPRTGDVIGAAQLVYASRRLNIYHQFDRMARLTAIREAAALGKPGMRYFVNFSPSAIYDPAVCLRGTLDAAREAGIPLDQLVFDLIEFDQSEGRERLYAILDYYRGKGVSVALDSLDGSLTTLQYVTELLPDYVKLDGDLTARAVTSTTGRRRLQSVIDLAKRLNIAVVAEGIETPEQARVSIESGADYLQGFLFAHPSNPPAELWSINAQTQSQRAA